MDYPLLNAFWTMCLIFLWVLWLILLFRIIGDIFRSQDLNNWAKTGWLVLVIVLPFLGVFIYVIARGHGMSEREVAQAERQQKQLRAYLRETAASGDQGAAMRMPWRSSPTSRNTVTSRTRSSRRPRRRSSPDRGPRDVEAIRRCRRDC